MCVCVRAKDSKIVSGKRDERTRVCVRERDNVLEREGVRGEDRR